MERKNMCIHMMPMGIYETIWYEDISNTNKTVPSKRYVYAYDVNVNLTEVIKYDANITSGIWKKFERHVYEYDANRNLTETIKYRWEGNNWVVDQGWEGFHYFDLTEIIELEDNWYLKTKDWARGGKNVYYWSELITSYPSKFFDLNFNIYPNPAKDILFIESNRPGKHFIAITSLNGQILYMDRMEGPTHQIDLSSFQKGLYFITVRSRDYVRTEKIIKL